MLIKKQGPKVCVWLKCAHRCNKFSNMQHLQARLAAHYELLHCTTVHDCINVGQFQLATTRNIWSMLCTLYWSEELYRPLQIQTAEPDGPIYGIMRSFPEQFRFPMKAWQAYNNGALLLVLSLKSIVETDPTERIILFGTHNSRFPRTSECGKTSLLFYLSAWCDTFFPKVP